MMIHRNSITGRYTLFLRALIVDNYGKKLALLFLLTCLFLAFPSAIHRIPSPIHDDFPQEPVPTDAETSVFDPFPFPEDLTPQVNFWKSIFTRYTTKQAVIHDDRYVNVIYEVIDTTSSEFSSEQEGWKAVKRAREMYEKLLQSLSKHWGKPREMTEEERRIYKLFAEIPESTYFKKKDAKDRVRVQVGQADRFQAGIIWAGQYLDTMKQIFAENDLPENLVYLPLIESGFNPFAKSHAGAAGMWQFMRSTGKQYNLKITSRVDERRDPLSSTRAAAQLLAHNYEETQSWPLAITAYNFGLQGIKNAVKTMESENIADIIEQYDGSRFGFASRNFYVEFLAALDICLRYTEHFGEIEVREPLAITQVNLPDYVSAKTLGKYSPLTETEIKKLNPALHSSVFNKGGFLPKNYKLNIPLEQKARFETGYASIPRLLKYAYLPVKARHRVKKGETLSAIAKRYKSSVKAIARANGIRNPRKIRAGQVLKIPGGYVALARNSSPTSVTQSDSGVKTHTVKKGQTLSTIAKMHNRSVKSITSLNDIKNPRKIKAGQVLKIPAETAKLAQKTDSKSEEDSSSTRIKTNHRVKTGQTLSSIARLHNTSVKAIAKLNRISNPRKIKAGQVLKIPEG